MQQNSTKKSFRVSWYLIRPGQALSAVLALFLALAGTGIASAQTVYTTVPPAQAGTSGLNRAPSGSVAFQRAASIYTAAEMANLPQGQPITKLGFNITAPAAAATTGNIKVYLVNSTDGSFLRSTTWATFLSATPAMQLVYDGPLTIPNTAGWYEITLTTPFTYTGNSVYMAFDWQRTGAATGAPTYATNSDPVAGTNGWRGASGAALPTDITGTSAFRPWLQLGYTPPADDAAVLAVWALGRLPLNTAAVPHEIKAAIGNKGSNPIVNRTFTLTVTGANPYTSQITASIPVGDTLIATFTGYTPTNTGSNTITVTTSTDDVATNNSVEMTQLTTANAMAYTQGNPAVATGAVGITATTGAGSGAFLARYTVANSTPVTVPSVRAVIANNTPSVGKRVFAVVLDASGTLLSRSAGYNIQASDLGNSVTFPMATPPTLTNTAFYVGLAVTPDATTAYYPVGTQTDGYVPDNAYYAILSDTTFTGVNAPQEVDFLGRFMLEAILQPVNDIGVAAVTGPASGCGLSSTEQICVVVQNYGSGAQSNIPVSYSINGGTPVTETVAGPIAGGASATYCFTATANFSVPGAYTVEVYSGNASDASAINDTTSSTINSVATPAVSFSGLPASVCSNGTAIALTGTPAGGTFSGPGITGSSFNPATAGAGTHNITYTVIQAGCTATVTNTVVVDTAPTVSFTGLAASYCSDEAPVTLLPTPATGTFSGPGISGNDFDPSTAGAGTHTITYTYTTGACTVTSTQTVIVTAPATVTFTGLANNYCVTSAAVTLTGAPAGGTFSGLGITGNTFNPATAGAGTHIITYTNSAGSCSGSSDQTVVVDPAPMATISGLAASYCVGEPVVTLTGTPAGGTFSGTGITGNDFDPATAGVGTHIITYTATQGLCTATTTDTVTINALPVVDAGADHSVCSDETAYMLTGFSPAGGTWSGTGVSANGEFNAVTAGNGQHILTYTVGQGGCTASDEVAVTVYAMPVATFTHTNTGPAYTFTPSSPALGVSYSWDFGDNNTSTDQNPTHTYTANGTYTVTLTIVHAMCTATTSQTLSVLVGMEDDLAAMLSLYPNPTNGKLTLEGIQLTSTAKVEVTNMLGQTLLINQWQPNQEKLLLDIAGLPSGSYLIRISDDKTSVVKQVVLQR